MLLFNYSGDGRAGIFTDISKHPMLLFNLKLRQQAPQAVRYFKTSYVTV